MAITAQSNDVRYLYDDYIHNKFLALALVYGPVGKAELAYAELEKFVKAFQLVFDVDMQVLIPQTSLTKEQRFKRIEQALDWMDKYAAWYKSQEPADGEAAQETVDGA